jgi:3-isopropylmalate/(R)-2-methylmalate dehydratase large subunit
VQADPRALGVGLWDPARSYSSATTTCRRSTTRPPHRRDHARLRAEHKLADFYDGEGICHVVLPERGHLKPGMFVVGGDSHSPTGGAFGAYMFGIGATEMAGVLATGEIWLRCPTPSRSNGAAASARRRRQGRDAVSVRAARHRRRPHQAVAVPRRAIRRCRCRSA